MCYCHILSMNENRNEIFFLKYIDNPWQIIILKSHSLGQQQQKINLINSNGNMKLPTFSLEIHKLNKMNYCVCF